MRCLLVVTVSMLRGDAPYALAYPEGAATYPAYAFALSLHHPLTTLVSTSPSYQSCHLERQKLDTIGRQHPDTTD